MEGILSSLLVASFSTREKNNIIREGKKERKASILSVGLENIPVNKRQGDTEGEGSYSVDEGDLPSIKRKVALYCHCY